MRADINGTMNPEVPTGEKRKADDDASPKHDNMLTITPLCVRMAIGPFTQVLNIG